MSVNAGAEEERDKCHDPMWPESEKVLKDRGVATCSILLRPATRQLFGDAEMVIKEQTASIASTEV